MVDKRNKQLLSIIFLFVQAQSLWRFIKCHSLSYQSYSTKVKRYSNYTRKIIMKNTSLGILLDTIWIKEVEHGGYSRTERHYIYK